VARNRARRLLREAWWQLAPGLEDGHELVLVARRSVADARAPQVAREIETLLRKAGVMRP
jgi:ribonuclease P protein component